MTFLTQLIKVHPSIGIQALAVVSRHEAELVAVPNISKLVRNRQEATDRWHPLWSRRGGNPALLDPHAFGLWGHGREPTRCLNERITRKKSVPEFCGPLTVRAWGLGHVEWSCVAGRDY